MQYCPPSLLLKYAGVADDGQLAEPALHQAAARLLPAAELAPRQTLHIEGVSVDRASLLFLFDGLFQELQARAWHKAIAGKLAFAAFLTKNDLEEYLKAKTEVNASGACAAEDVEDFVENQVFFDAAFQAFTAQWVRHSIGCGLKKAFDQEKHETLTSLSGLLKSEDRPWRTAVLDALADLLHALESDLKTTIHECWRLMDEEAFREKILPPGKLRFINSLCNILPEKKHDYFYALLDFADRCEKASVYFWAAEIREEVKNTAELLLGIKMRTEKKADRQECRRPPPPDLEGSGLPAGPPPQSRIGTSRATGEGQALAMTGQWQKS